MADDKPAPEIRTEIAYIGGGRDITRGYIPEGRLEPQDSILQRFGWYSYDLYRDLARDDQVKSTLQQRRLAVISREWFVEAGGDRPVDEEAAEFIRETLAGLRWDRINDAMLWGVFYGFAVGECLWEARGAQWWLADIKVRDRERFRWNVDGQLLLRTMEQPNGVAMPERKFWTFSTGADHTDDPYGLGLAHWLYWPVFFKRNGIKFWLTFLDTFGSPSKIGKIPTSKADDAYAKMLEALGALRSGADIAIPEGMVIELLEATRSGSVDNGDLIDKMDAAISKVVLSQTMTTDDGSSLSQAQVHGEVRDEVVKADGDLLCGSFNDGPVKWLTDWNFAGAAYPTVWRRVESEPDLKPVAERDRIIYEMGYEPTEEYIRETYGEGWVKRKTAGPPVFPVPDTGPDDTPEDNPDSEEEQPPAGFAVDEQDSIGDLLDQELPAEGDDWEKLLGPTVQPIIDLAADTDSLEDLRDRLAEVLTEQDVSALQEHLAKSAFAARMAGEVGAPITDSDDEG